MTVRLKRLSCHHSTARRLTFSRNDLICITSDEATPQGAAGLITPLKPRGEVLSIIKRRSIMDDFDSIPLPSHANPIVIQWLKQGQLKIMPSGCWEWQMHRNSKGYGQLGFDGKITTSHRVAINAPKGEWALHSCDNPPCCNPKHLRFGTVQDNNLDKKERKGGINIQRQKYGACACGRAKHVTTKDCHECRSIRLGHPPCHCGEISRYKGLCNKHHQQELKKIRRLK